jgi:hypothetical protein
MLFLRSCFFCRSPLTLQALFLHLRQYKGAHRMVGHIQDAVTENHIDIDTSGIMNR